MIALLLFNVCHFLADYTHLSTSWMLKAKRFGTPIFPIVCHGAIHAILFSIVSFILFGIESIYWVLPIELVSHFTIDLMKGKANNHFQAMQNPTNQLHWIAFGLDQLLHQVVIVCIWVIIGSES